MAVKKVTYVEPAAYFNKEMLKAADEWDKAHAKKQKTTAEAQKKSRSK